MNKNIIILVALIIGGCSSFKNNDSIRLKQSGWVPGIKSKLEKIITIGKNKKLPVVFDFDNTLICRDIGEATFSVMSRDGILKMDILKKSFSPKIFKNNINLTKYYEDFLNATKHQNNDSSPYANGYAWVVQAMAGLTPKEIINNTKKAYRSGLAFRDHQSLGKQTKIVVKNDQTSYRVPYFYPQMIELVGLFLKNNYDVYIVSASNVWSVRWMASQLNQKLKQMGFKKEIVLKNVIGVSTLLQDKNGKLYKDMLLARSNDEYTNLNHKLLSELNLTAQIVYPLTGYYGKVANIIKWIGKRPYFVAGDSPNDHPMLSFGKYKLWLARLEKEGYQKKVLSLIKEDKRKYWLIQPTLYKKSSGFVADYEDLNRRFNQKTPESILKVWHMVN